MSDIFEEDEHISAEELTKLEDPQEFQNLKPLTQADFPHPLYRLKLDYSCESLYATYENEKLQPNTKVIIPTRYGDDLAIIRGEVKLPIATRPEEVIKILHKASEAEIKQYTDHLDDEKEAFKVCQKKIEENHLDMKIISAHYVLKESKVLFFFSADNRVDFRDLVKDLVSVFRMRIELRQIGVRDESRITGGLGVCGRPYCCHGVTDKLKPVSIRMAKDQNLSLNSLKISGQCGRLLCCLAYEHDWYIEERKDLPCEGIRFKYDGSNFKVSEVHPITNSVKIQGEDGRVLEIDSSQLEKTDNRWHIKHNSEQK